MTVINRYNNEVEYSNTSKTDLNYITGDKEYLVEFTINISKYIISTFKISFEKLQNKYAHVLDFDNFLYVPLFSIENVGIQNFFIDLDDYITGETIKLFYTYNFTKRISVKGILYRFNKIDLNKTIEDNNIYVESYIKQILKIIIFILIKLMIIKNLLFYKFN